MATLQTALNIIVRMTNLYDAVGLPLPESLRKDIIALLESVGV